MPGEEGLTERDADDALNHDVGQLSKFFKALYKNDDARCMPLSRHSSLLEEIILARTSYAM